jgi:hypothetical protein
MQIAKYSPYVISERRDDNLSFETEGQAFHEKLTIETEFARVRKNMSRHDLILNITSRLQYAFHVGTEKRSHEVQPRVM